jgi:cystathionine beta-lyase
MRLGLGVGANDVEAVLRSLPSIGLRFAAQDRSARALAQWWQSQAQCVQLLHPAFAGAPGHEHWQDVCGESGLSAGLFSVMLHERYTQDQVDAFCNDLKLFRLGYSWGGPVSLVVPYALQSMRSAWPAHLARGTLVRFSTGLESPEALIQDLAQSLLKNLPA